MASSIAIYLYFTKKESIGSIFTMLKNYAYQQTLSELKEKLEKLSDYNAKDSIHHEQIINIVNDIVGQMNGNDHLKVHFKVIITRFERMISERDRLTEPLKRSLVAEFRERLRHLNVENFDEIVGK
ncbi:hypothetical protein RA178_03195 [Shewanella oncorhynchi]|uniref:Uncharacterized protein n=1 Tax=Shewanella oncorhynchi TaxID=2726434 RepID=A0AA50Q3U3_9GAMM|nr:hypothetical protein [Shewanella oncorhynchi]WMB73644.1 hypothetical protein RA178_03195 [Shewanella oncorhynchi]